jgi:hypothetical protein
MNEYKVVFYNHNISDGYIQVIKGILAKSDNHAIEKIMNTWNIYKNWVIFLACQPFLLKVSGIP